MIRALLLSLGEPVVVGPPSTLPPDPTLTEWRAVTRPFSVNQNVTSSGETGRTWSYPPKSYPPILFAEDCNGITLVFSGHSQGTVSSGAILYVSVKAAGWNDWREVTFGGEDHLVYGDSIVVESDIVEGVFGANSELKVRIYAPGNENVNVGFIADVLVGADGRDDEPFVKNSEYPSGGPWPQAFMGRTRESVQTFAIYGDSISAAANWFNVPIASRGLTGINYGRNVMQFSSRWLDPFTMKGVTHMYVEFGVNDLGGGMQPPQMWERAVACYDYIKSFGDIPVWQATATPTVADTAGNNCLTLEGQTVDNPRGPARLLWNAFLRDGAPCAPGSREHRAIGSGGDTIRAGDPGHPLVAVVDMAAAVEHGGAENPSGKWRVDHGPIGGDGVHPNDTQLMHDVIHGWLDSIVGVTVS